MGLPGGHADLSEMTAGLRPKAEAMTAAGNELCVCKGPEAGLVKEGSGKGRHG